MHVLKSGFGLLLLTALCVVPVLSGCRSGAPGGREGTEKASASRGRSEQRERDVEARPANVEPTVPQVGAEADLATYIRSHYVKSEHMIEMRDGVRLFTQVYAPIQDKSKPKQYPILLNRTPYSVGPYGESEYRGSLGPSDLYAREGFVFAFQDVRGRFMSEGEFENMRPHMAEKSARTTVIDESTDTYDTIEWLVRNVAHNNGRVGLYGISYPGFYSSAGMIDAHPALKAVSPQAPIADWYFDDFFHHGAFFLPHAFNFFNSFGRPRAGPTREWKEGIDHGTPDGYQFFLDLGPLSNADAQYFKGEVAYWNTIAAHPNRDEFWRARDILPHLRNVAPAVMTVGGWFDAEDLYGALATYQSTERQNPGITNLIVMGPWRHGGWARSDGDRLGNIHFGSKTSAVYRETVELPFFKHHLKDDANPNLPEAFMFETGANRWRRFDRWPPADLRPMQLTLRSNGEMVVTDIEESKTTASEHGTYVEFVSDPARPVPFTETIHIGMTAEYMTDDQRFAARRPDVAVFQTAVLASDVTIAGPIMSDLWVSTTGTDSDWVVKLIDVYPPSATDYEGMGAGKRLGGYQMMVRSEVIRGRFREDYGNPKPFTPGEPTYVDLPLQDVLHTFRAGHRIMVQIQCTWFPLVDRNPQTYVPNIFEAREEDFIKATQRVYCGGEKGTRLRVGILGQGPS